MIQIYRYTCAHLCMPFSIRITTRWGNLTPLDHRVHVSELRAYRFSWLLIRVEQRKRGSSANHL